MTSTNELVKKFIDGFASNNDIAVLKQIYVTTCSLVDDRIVMLNIAEVPKRQHPFSIAHEIAHIVAHDVYFDGLPGYITESDADYYAVKLLYDYCRSINLKFNSTLDFITQVGIPTRCFNIAEVVLHPEQKLALILFSRYSKDSWTVKAHP